MSGKRNGFRLALVLMVTSTLGAAGASTAAAAPTATTAAASAPTASLISTSSSRCPGPDITIGQIVTVSGQSEAFPDVPIAAKVAVHAVRRRAR